MADRWSRLAVAAHVEGAIDFGDRRYDQRLKELWVMRELEARRNVYLHERIFDWHLARAMLRPKDAEYHYKHVEALYVNIGRMLMPWKSDWDKMVTATVQDVWARFVAVGNDPQERKRLKQVQQRLDEMAVEDAGKADEMAKFMANVLAKRRKRRG